MESQVQAEDADNDKLDPSWRKAAGRGATLVTVHIRYSVGGYICTAIVRRVRCGLLMQRPSRPTIWAEYQGVDSAILQRTRPCTHHVKNGNFQKRVAWALWVNEVTCYVSGYQDEGLLTYDWKHFTYEDYDEWLFMIMRKP